MPEDLASIRHQIALLAARKSAWCTEFSPSRPIHWAPGEATDPRTKRPFTDLGAKEFIAQLAESGPDPEIVTLDQPPGAKGYVWIVAGVPGESLYIKVQLGAGQILGRSFHLSNR